MHLIPLNLETQGHGPGVLSSDWYPVQNHCTHALSSAVFIGIQFNTTARVAFEQALFYKFAFLSATEENKAFQVVDVLFICKDSGVPL